MKNGRGLALSGLLMSAGWGQSAVMFLINTFLYSEVDARELYSHQSPWEGGVHFIHFPFSFFNDSGWQCGPLAQIGGLLM